MIFYDRSEERTGVQEASPYFPETNIQCDFVMVYGLHNLKERIEVWKKHGYIIHLMTGVAWGEYQDYLYGKFDGIDHHDEGQVNRSGAEINHGKDVPYMVPSVAFSRYLTEKLKYAIDCGVEAIHLEEPELWAHAGYSEAFKREWLLYYNKPWEDPASTADAQFRASKLKQYLYTRMLDRLCSELKEYTLVKHKRKLRFYVPTHSLISYSQIFMVSPESALIDLPGIDGYIAQIWTGTARVPNVFEGIRKERTFETAFLEYGIMQELVRDTGRKMWFLHDPVEDDPKHTWSDYRANYYRTVTASLMHPGICDYEVSPWPSRVFRGKYPTEDGTGREGMPAEYRTNLLTVMNALRDMKQPDAKWTGNVNEVGLLLADSAMFQRIYPDDDIKHEEAAKLDFSSFYGLALPLLKHGTAVRPVQLDNIRRRAGYLDKYRALVLSYEYMKPEFPDIHNALAGWIKAGGMLIYVGDGKDAFHKINAWWNSGNSNYDTPAQHLFEACDLNRSLSEGIYPVGEGFLAFLNADPVSFSRNAENAGNYRSFVAEVLKKKGIDTKDSSALVMERGCYTVTSVMDETETSIPFKLNGLYIDLYKTYLDVLENPVLYPGSVGLYYNLAKINKSQPCEILASAARIERYKATARSCSFKAVSAEGSECVMRIYVRRPPVSVNAERDGKKENITCKYDDLSKTIFIRFANSANGVWIKIKFCG